MFVLVLLLDAADASSARHLRLQHDSSMNLNHPHSAFLLNGSKVGAPEDAEAMKEDQTGECLKNTGGTCVTSDCDKSRGATECSTGRCFCTTGCTSIGGKCYEERNKLVLSQFTLKNQRYPEYYMYVSSWGKDLKVEKSPGSEAKFDMYQLPGQGDRPEAFVITSHKYPNYAMGIRRRESCTEDSNGTESCTTYYWGKAQHLTMGMDASVESAAMQLVAAPDHPGAFMIRAYDYPRRYLYVSRTGWHVDSYRKDPGTGGYWVPDPPLGATLRAYNGARCSWDCGGAAAHTPATALLSLVVGFALVQ